MWYFMQTMKPRGVGHGGARCLMKHHDVTAPEKMSRKIPPKNVIWEM